MSKLADRLKEVTERTVATRPMGFRAPGAVQAKIPSLLLLASVEADESEAVGAAIRDGAAGVLMPVGPATSPDSLSSISTAAAGGIWGGSLEMGGKDEVEKLKQAGAHFVLLRSADISAEALNAEDIDLVLEVDQSWTDMQLRPVGQLEIAAALFRLTGAEGLTISQLLQCRRIAGLVGKPVFAVLPSGTGTGLLLNLRDSGVDGVVVPAAAVSEFHNAIRDLPAPKRHGERMSATLPSVGGHQLHEEEEEEDDE